MGFWPTDEVSRRNGRAPGASCTADLLRKGVLRVSGGNNAELSDKLGATIAAVCFARRLRSVNLPRTARVKGRVIRLAPG
jgi:hypothetical protein